MNRKILTVTMALVILLGLSGLALAGNTANVTQTSNDNEVLIGQTGSGNDIVLDQVAATENDAEMYQSGTNNGLLVGQYAGSDNDTYTLQDGSGNRITVSQTAKWGGPIGSQVITYATQVGVDNGINIQQGNGQQEIYIDQIGSGNKITGGVGATDPPNPTITLGGGMGKAFQVISTATGFNNIHLDQTGDDNTVGLYQESGDINIFDCVQDGDLNEVLLWQGANASYGRNDVYIDQYGGANSLKAYQYGDNNYVNALQTNGGNSLFSWQNATSGYNDLDVSQSGGASATVIQIATAGNNIANITQ